MVEYDSVWKDLLEDTFIYSEFILLWYPTGHIGLWSFYRQVIWGLGHMRIHQFLNLKYWLTLWHPFAVVPIYFLHGQDSKCRNVRLDIVSWFVLLDWLAKFWEYVRNVAVCQYLIKIYAESDLSGDSQHCQPPPQPLPIYILTWYNA